MNPMHTTLRFLRDRPAISTACLLALGVGLRDTLPCRPAIWISSAILLAIFARCFWRQSILAAASLAVAVASLGTAAAQLDRYFYPANEISGYLAAGPKMAQVQVLVTQKPKIILSESDRPMPPRMELVGAVTRILQTSGWTDASGLIRVSLPSFDPRITPGQRLQLIGQVSRPAAPLNPSAVDWAAIDREQHLLAEMRINRADCVKIVSEPGLLARWFDSAAAMAGTVRDGAAKQLAMGFPSESARPQALLSELTLGIQSIELVDLRNQSASLGISYQLSISGLHLAIIAFFAYWVCRLLRVDPWHGRLIALAVALIYCLAATPSEAGVRSLLLCAIAALAVMSHRSVDRSQLLAIVAAALLLWHPSDLFQAEFQVSLAAAIGLLIFYSRTIRWLRGPIEPTPAISRPARLRRAIANRAIGLLAGSAIAWAATLPLVAYWFEQPAPAGVAASLLVLPLTALCLIAGIAKIFLTLCMPGAATLFAACAARPADWLLHCVATLAAHLGAPIESAPSIKLIVVYYALLLLPLAALPLPVSRFFQPKSAFNLIPRRSWKPIFPVGAILLLFMGARVPPAPMASISTPSELQITMLSIGAGQCIVVQPPGENPWILDTGATYNKDAPMALVQSCVAMVGSRQIAGMLLTHGDSNRIGAAADLLRAFPVGQLLLSPDFQEQAKGNHFVQDVLDAANEASQIPRAVHRGDEWSLYPGVKMKILWPDADFHGNAADAGAVARISFAGRSILLPSELSAAALSQLRQYKDTFKSDVMIAPHHGGVDGTSAALLSAVEPTEILASCDARQTKKDQAYNALVGAIPIYRTGQCGAVTIHIKSDGTLWITTFRPPPAAAMTPEAAAQ